MHFINAILYQQRTSNTDNSNDGSSSLFNAYKPAFNRILLHPTRYWMGVKFFQYSKRDSKKLSCRDNSYMMKIVQLKFYFDLISNDIFE